MNAETAVDDAATRLARPRTTTPCVRIIGCGRSHRSDDRLGLHVVDRLSRMSHPCVRLATSEAPGADLLLDLDGCELLIIVDAAMAGPQLRPGEWIRIDVGHSTEARITPVRVVGGEPTHFLGVNTALALGADLGLLPKDVWVYVIAASDVGYGEVLSPGLAERASELADRIRDDVERWLERRDRGDA